VRAVSKADQKVRKITENWGVLASNISTGYANVRAEGV